MEAWIRPTEPTGGRKWEKKPRWTLMLLFRWFLSFCLFSFAPQMLDGSVWCFQLCPTPAPPPDLSSSWMCIPPTAAETSCVPMQTCSMAALRPLIWFCGRCDDDGGDDDGPRWPCCPCVFVSACSRIHLRCPPGTGRGETKWKCRHPSAAGGQLGQSDHYLTPPATHSSWTDCRQKGSPTALGQQSTMGATCRGAAKWGYFFYFKHVSNRLIRQSAQTVLLLTRGTTVR